MSARRRRRRRALTTGADKWKTKYWFELKAPDYIGDYTLGHTPASDISQVIGRTIKSSLMDLTNDFDDLNYHLTFKVTQISGGRAKTEFYGQALSRDYRRSQIRNHRSQVDGVFNFTLKDGAKVRITTFVVTPVRAAHNTKKDIRRAVHNGLENLLADLNFPAFVNKVITYELRDELLPEAEEIFPIKLLEISKVKVVRLPEDRQMQDVSELELPEDEEVVIEELGDNDSDEEEEEDEDEEKDSEEQEDEEEDD